MKHPPYKTACAELMARGTIERSARDGASSSRILSFPARRIVAVGHVRRMLFTCQAGYETLLARELVELHGGEVSAHGSGWLLASHVGSATSRPDGSAEPSVPPLAFAHLTLLAPQEIRGESVNALASRAADFFFEQIRGERLEHAWPSIWLGPHDLVGLGRRVSAVESAFTERLKRKLARVAKLATSDLPRIPGVARGLFVFFADFDRAFLARACVVNGPRRMADDPLAPSRSYLKVEEAFVVLGREPQPGETVCDLGAAPGGWSYSAAKRGARVIAIDNGPLKSGALDHPRIEHRREDAFRFTPAAGEVFDWLFCDLVEEPHHVLRDLIEPWLRNRWCRSFVSNLKFGRVDPIALLGELRAPRSCFSAHAVDFRVCHLYHDREEYTVVGHASS